MVIFIFENLRDPVKKDLDDYFPEAVSVTVLSPKWAKPSITPFSSNCKFRSQTFPMGIVGLI